MSVGPAFRYGFKETTWDLRSPANASISWATSTIGKTLHPWNGAISGIVPQFGGKCFDITMKSPQQAAELASTGFDYENEHQPLVLLGAKTIRLNIYFGGVPRRGTFNHSQILWRT